MHILSLMSDKIARLSLANLVHYECMNIGWKNNELDPENYSAD